MILFQKWLISTTFLIFPLEIPKNGKEKEKNKKLHLCCGKVKTPFRCV